MTANRDHLTRLYLNGAVALLDHLLAAERKADPEAFAEVDRALAAGCLLALHTRLAPSTGLCMLDIEVSEPTGKAHPLLAIEMLRPQGGTQ
ncbi:MAG: hypothetical protein IPI03_14535 [Rubrivivax sp.]|nr:hypothetical protein [Rubrivivax sp.]MBK8529187.1 hypothetical protein [Rubrivivax sp.]